MKILEQIRKANDRLIKHIEQSIDLLEIDTESVHIQSFYIYIDNSGYLLSIIKQKNVYLYDFTLTNFIGNLRGCFKFDECTGKVKIIKTYENNILGNIS